MIFRATLASLLLLLGACSTVHPAKVLDSGALSRMERAYVVKHDNSTRGVELSIQSALALRGLAVSAGSMQDKPNGGDAVSPTDAYVTYVDRWNWDVGMYLSALTISIFDNRTGKLIAQGRFSNSPFFHTFPDVDSKSAEVLESIFDQGEVVP